MKYSKCKGGDGSGWNEEEEADWDMHWLVCLSFVCMCYIQNPLVKCFQLSPSQVSSILMVLPNFLKISLLYLSSLELERIW